MKVRSIFVDASHIDSGFQGTHTFLTQIYGALHKQQPHVQLYFGSNNPEALEKSLTAIKNKIIVPYKSASRLKQGIIDAPNLLKKIKPDFAHYQYVVPLGKKHCPYILTIHDVLIFTHPHLFNWKFRAPRKKLYQYSHAKSDVITTVSEFSRAGIESNLGKSKTIWLTPNAVENTAISEIEKKQIKAEVTAKYQLKERFILSVGRYEKRKNFELLIAAFNQLQLTDCDLVLAGNGVDQIKNTTGIKILNNVSPKALTQLYQAADLFVFPSEAEGFGIPPMEAVNAYCPTITSNATALNEFTFLRNWQFPVNDLESLKQAMVRALNELQQGEMEQVRADMHAKYSWQKSAENLFTALQHFSG